MNVSVLDKSVLQQKYQIESLYALIEKLQSDNFKPVTLVDSNGNVLYRLNGSEKINDINMMDINGSVFMNGASNNTYDPENGAPPDDKYFKNGFLMWDNVELGNDGDISLNDDSTENDRNRYAAMHNVNTLWLTGCKYDDKEGAYTKIITMNVFDMLLSVSDYEIGDKLNVINDEIKVINENIVDLQKNNEKFADDINGINTNFTSLNSLVDKHDKLLYGSSDYYDDHVIGYPKDGSIFEPHNMIDALNNKVYKLELDEKLKSYCTVTDFDNYKSEVSKNHPTYAQVWGSSLERPTIGSLKSSIQENSASISALKGSLNSYVQYNTYSQTIKSITDFIG